MCEYSEVQQRNIDVVEFVQRNALADNVLALQPVIADDFTIYEAEGLPFGGVFVGIEGLIRCMKGMSAFFSNKRLLPPEFVAAGDDRVIMISTINADIASNGEHINMPTVSIWDFKNGKVATVRPFFFDTKHVYDRAQL